MISLNSLKGILHCLLYLLLFMSLLSAIILFFGLIAGGRLDSQDKPDASAADRAWPCLTALRQASFGLTASHPHKATHFPPLHLSTGHQGESGRNAPPAIPQVKTWKHGLWPCLLCPGWVALWLKMTAETWLICGMSLSMSHWWSGWGALLLP